VDKDSPDDFKKNGESPNHDCIVDDNILEKQIDSWRSYENVLREENRIIFDQMLEDVKRYSETAKVKGENFSFESMCMILLIIQQQRMIKRLIRELSNKKDDQFKLTF
jgi:hypothetical protein